MKIKVFLYFFCPIAINYCIDYYYGYCLIQTLLWLILCSKHCMMSGQKPSGIKNKTNISKLISLHLFNIIIKCNKIQYSLLITIRLTFKIKLQQLKSEKILNIKTIKKNPFNYLQNIYNTMQAKKLFFTSNI